MIWSLLILLKIAIMFKKSKKFKKISKSLKNDDFLPGESLKNHLSEKPFCVLTSCAKRLGLATVESK